MNTSKVIHQAKLNDWANTIREHQASSLNVTEWCQSNGIAKAQFYYWKRKLKDQFVEVQLPDIVPLNTPVVQLIQHLKNSPLLSFPLEISQSKSQKIRLTIS